MAIKAILFDMDGVLIDAKDWHYEALNRALELFGMPISRADHLTTFDGLPTRKKLEMLSLERGLPKDLHDFINEMKQQYTMDIIHARCNPRFTHEYALSSLKHAGYFMAVCSNSVRDTVETMMRKANLMQYLDLLVSNEDVSKGKPDPEMYTKAINFLNLKPEECLVVEDNENGIRAARASGAHLLVVRTVDDTNFNNIQRRIAEIDSVV
ncbi:Haloacid dehalogenase superfamily, subfamily IA, variant 2 with 3rd motif like haloacid dehalogenase/haloacid dehalogenase superfamily, subfamily IA, variant 3 with third motif having DD or ED [Pseudomonas peli]|jgi:beta-phosphoglucomutase|uniref:Haloacid dehalogenase superfamily, subfamily IA, variant 2 with 3rd motif like haloacid dehalogenase/haloacid dehalogenase superfamily, subfamily IA, variant 3 with third motif having DD or ED n=1 Tax=Pseudomonas peli TaxID=592361 RepID=A0AB37Z4G2_9PSED|nr:HAD family phosphatase [Pseudomonas peli]NMZ69248.1 HAD family phosphatase [Pseudomonas peli]SCW33116.1 Haloacid dehalogenase superfamily, subfamily IA, variant 2 with 3rd motif like haloacid dehalogenase/haloacid dehalogenase superfamily, subfamily IA, variant 3 with third motif having DD or ED [Pseudomonas peli]